MLNVSCRKPCCEAASASAAGHAGFPSSRVRDRSLDVPRASLVISVSRPGASSSLCSYSVMSSARSSLALDVHARVARDREGSYGFSPTYGGGMNSE